jgi:hypothetical protein
MRGELLRFADIAWLTKLRLGAALKLWAIGLAFVLIVSSFALGTATGIFPWTLARQRGLRIWRDASAAVFEGDAEGVELADAFFTM